MQIGLNNLGLTGMPVPFSPLTWFLGGEQGGVYESYDPNQIVQRRNLLTWSEDLTNAAWVKTELTTPSAPVAGYTKIVESVNNGPHSATQSAVKGYLTGQYANVYARVKTGGERRFLSVDMQNGPVWGGTNPGLKIDLQTGTIVALGTALNPNILALGGGEFAVWFSALVVAAGTSGARATLYDATGSTSIYVGDGASGAFVGFLHAEVSAAPINPPSYQKVTDWTSEYLAAGGSRVSLWQDTSGQTPLTAVEQSVGLRLDMRLGGARGPEIWNDAATSFAGSATKVSPGVYRIFTPDGTNSQVACGTGLTVGEWYEVTFNVDSVAVVGSGFIGIGNALEVSIALSVGAKRCFIKTTTNAPIIKRSGGVAQDFQISNVSWKLAAGNHSTQATAASRGILRARYNLLTKSDDYADAAWIKTDLGVTSDAIAGPDGVPADLVTNQGANSDVLGQQFTVPDANPRRYRVAMRRGNHDWARAQVSTSDGVTSGFRVWINLATGAKGTAAAIGTGTLIAANVRDGLNGWWIVELDGTVPAATVTNTFTMSASADGNTARVAGGTRYMGGSDFRPLNDVQAGIPGYQRVNTATDYDTAGFPHYIARDGIDDSDATAAIDATASNKLTAILGETKLSEAIFGVALEFSPNADLNNGSFYVAAPLGPAGNNYSGAMKGTGTLAGVGGTVNTYPAPSSVVLAYEADLGAPMQKLWIDGAVKQTNPASVGAGNFGNWPMFFGRRNGTSSPVTERDYGRVVCFAARTPGQIAQASRWMAAKMGRVLP